MRLLLMISRLTLSGAERSLVSVIPYLKRLPGLVPVLCTLDATRDGPLVVEFNKTGIQRFDLGARRLIDPAAWHRFIKLLKDEKIDIISTQDQYTNLFGALAFWFANKPVVMARHVMFEPSDKLRDAVRAKLTLWAMRTSTNRVIAVSEAVRKNLIDKSKIPSSKVETVYNGIDVNKFFVAQSKGELRRKLGWGLDELIIIMVAVLRRGKGHEVLFDSIQKLVSSTPNARIKLVGDGELNDVLRHQAKKYGSVIEFMGERVDIPELLCASDVFVLPSWSEALPTVLIEAGGAALPVVATDVGGAGEIILEGETGYLVNPGDSTMLADRLVAILKDPERAQRMGLNARKRVTELFSLDRQARALFALFNKVMGET